MSISFEIYWYSKKFGYWRISDFRFQIFRLKESTSIHKYESRFIIWIGSQSYEAQEDPWSAICKLESQWHNSIWLQRTEKQEPMVWVPIEVQRPKIQWFGKVEDNECPSSSREQIHPSSTFCSIQFLNRSDDAYPH